MGGRGIRWFPGFAVWNNKSHVLCEIPSQNIRWREIMKNSKYQPVAFTCICRCVYTHMSSWNTHTHTQYIFKQIEYAFFRCILIVKSSTYGWGGHDSNLDNVVVTIDSEQIDTKINSLHHSLTEAHRYQLHRRVKLYSFQHINATLYPPCNYNNPPMCPIDWFNMRSTSPSANTGHLQCQLLHDGSHCGREFLSCLRA